MNKYKCYLLVSADHFTLKLLLVLVLNFFVFLVIECLWIEPTRPSFLPIPVLASDLLVKL
jgi:hypothetical protein